MPTKSEMVSAADGRAGPAACCPLDWTFMDREGCVRTDRRTQEEEGEGHLARTPGPAHSSQGGIGPAV